jgi:hypothetical protein
MAEVEESTCSQYDGKMYTVQVDWRKMYVCRIESTCPIRNVDRRCHLEWPRPDVSHLTHIIQRVGGEWLRDVVSGCDHQEHYRYRGTLRCVDCGIEIGEDGPVMPAELVHG